LAAVEATAARSYSVLMAASEDVLRLADLSPFDTALENDCGGRGLKKVFGYRDSMSTPAAVEPPTLENVHLYRAAVLAWRKSAIEERSRGADIKLANPHVAENAAARTVHELVPEMTFAQAHPSSTPKSPQCKRKWRSRTSLPEK
jgi:hypothetical protein